MYVWSKTLAVALVVTLWGYGTTALQAKDHHKGQSCEKAESSCPAPVLQKPAPVESSCCPMPSVQSHCGAPVQTGCCPVDPKDVSKAEKNALHAQHEAAEACKRQQKVIAKANHDIDEKYAKEQARIDRSNTKLNREVSELQEANAKYESFYGGSTEATAAVTPQPEVQAPVAESTPPPVIENESPSIAEAAPAPALTPVPEMAPPAPVQSESTQSTESQSTDQSTQSQQPKQLPRTASPLALIGLIGLASSVSGYVTRFFRR